MELEGVREEEEGVQRGTAKSKGGVGGYSVLVDPVVLVVVEGGVLWGTGGVALFT